MAGCLLWLLNARYCAPWGETMNIKGILDRLTTAFAAREVAEAADFVRRVEERTGAEFPREVRAIMIRELAVKGRTRYVA